MSNALAATAYYQVNLQLELSDDNALERLARVVQQLTHLLMLLIVVWQDVERIVFVVSDVVEAVSFANKVVAIVFNSVVYGVVG